MASQALLAMPMVPHNLDLSMTDIRNPGVHLGVCLAIMTDHFALQVLSIKADKILNTVTAGL